jgi:hypothetical protein
MGQETSCFGDLLVSPQDLKRLVAIDRDFVDETSLWLNDSVSYGSLKMFTYLNLCLAR